LERITYYNEENNFTVARLQEKGKKGLTTIVGRMAGITPGESLKLSGEWVHNQKYGEQFQVEQYEIITPSTLNGLEKYLGSGMIKGIGPVMARRIVKTFRLQTLDIIENSPEKLSQVEGIGQKRIEMIKKAWDEHKEIKEIMIFLQGHGVSASHSARIFKQYGNEAINIVKENPYRLAADIRGIGFVTADRIARNLGIDPASVIRAEEGALFVLREFMNEGHVYYPYEPLVDKTVELLEVEREIVVRAIANLFEQRRVILEDLNSAEGPFIPNNKAVYLASFYTVEKNLAKKLLILKHKKPFQPPTGLEAVLSRVEKKLQIRLAPMQKEAVLKAIQNRVLVITGGPGTGKTTIIRAILELSRTLGFRSLLTAPTGRAARRMKEAAGYEAVTIHRLLEYSPARGSFQRNADNPLDTDMVIVDEASMIDIILMYQLVNALPPRASFILVGDVNQLPPVGPGNVLNEIIASGKFEVVTLTDIFRQSRESRIVVNAHRINSGKFPLNETLPPGERSDFYFIVEDDPQLVVEKILKLCTHHIPRRFGLHGVSDIQVLTPMYRGITGVDNLNVQLQRVFNAGGYGIDRGSRTYKVRDKVMQLVNNYDKEVFNGDIGFITEIDEQQKLVRVDFEGRHVSYEFSELDELVTAYAISVHKAQGSEYPAVIMPVMIQHYMLLQRNLIYTGITRGKKLVILIGSKKALAIAIRNNKPQLRYTMLGERLNFEQ
jgi:exodeoxyribonuclease V alpha subunit